MMTIVLDADGTLWDSTPRIDFAKAKQWEEFHSRCIDDQPHDDVLYLLRMLPWDCVVILCTARTERWRGLTEQWLAMHKIGVDTILMRPNDDFRPAAEVKLNLLEKHFGSKELVLGQVSFCLDDTDRVVEAFRNYGLNCWQVRNAAN